MISKNVEATLFDIGMEIVGMLHTTASLSMDKMFLRKTYFYNKRYGQNVFTKGSFVASNFSLHMHRCSLKERIVLWEDYEENTRLYNSVAITQYALMFYKTVACNIGSFFIG